jgi:transposase
MHPVDVVKDLRGPWLHAGLNSRRSWPMDDGLARNDAERYLAERRAETVSALPGGGVGAP